MCVCKGVWNGSDPEEWRYREEGGGLLVVDMSEPGGRRVRGKKQAHLRWLVESHQRPPTPMPACGCGKEKYYWFCTKRADVAFPREGRHGLTASGSTDQRRRRQGG